MTQVSDPDEKTRGWRGSRELWLAAARETLIESGVDAVKIQPLAAKVGLARTSFYWFFEDRAQLLRALLDDWHRSNTAPLVQATEAYAETIAEAVLNVIGVFLSDGFEPRLDLAVRGWAMNSDEVAALTAAADAERLAALQAMFVRFGCDSDEADVRARTMYLVQVGYISMQMQEDIALRLSRIPNYVKTFAGQAPRPEEMERFCARLGLSGP
ncbi:TetR/AcrR family transcriptional regulator [Oceaniglobus roseus]|uniref:TetR/AcrR family transcriptional regulator n=1 Tax=Oceaniglobus roseus TaxID=1737570 RepID=UPI000C7F0C63|nr:TetR/AcrR family transcriptional regulator [Kandeliimicrobium roseum]